MEKIDYFKKFPMIPEDYQFKDYKKTTIDYIKFILNPNNKYVGKDAKGNDVVIETSSTHQGDNYKAYFGEEHDCVGFASYFGKEFDSANCEGINKIALVLSGSLVGLDMTKFSYDGKSEERNYVKELVNFFLVEDKQFVMANLPHRLTGSTFWYELLPDCLFSALYDFYPQETYLKDIILKSANEWKNAIDDLGGETFNIDGLVSFNLKTREKVIGKWKEPDAASGLAYIMYCAYSLTKDNDKESANDFLKHAIWCMDYYNNLEMSPFYEELAIFAVSIGAKLNKFFGKHYDIDKFIRFICDGTSFVRNGWGMIDEKWGNASCYGLVGSKVDGGGYAFAMNTFQYAWALLPLLKYEPSYATSIGKWILNASNAARYFYGDSLPTTGTEIFQEYGEDIYQHFNVHTWTHYDGDYQSCNYFSNQAPASFIAYEGLRKFKKGFAWTEDSNRVYYYRPTSPYASGDCYTYNWKGCTDLGLYGSSNVGFFGGVIEKTDVDGILLVDINKLDFLENKNKKIFLLYNPFKEDKMVTYIKNEKTVIRNYTTNEEISLLDGKVLVKAFDSIIIVEE